MCRNQKIAPLRSSLAQAEPGRKRVLDVENWAEIRRLYRAEGLPIRAIARVMGVSRNTVRAAVASDGPPRYLRRARFASWSGVGADCRRPSCGFPGGPSKVAHGRNKKSDSH